MRQRFRKVQYLNTRRLITAGLILLAVAASLGRAYAHSFDAVLVVPNRASDSVERGMIAAFLVASEERDGHADQTSDGHLGGMDVYLTPVRGLAWDEILAAAPDFIVLNAQNAGAVVPSGVSAVLVRPMPPSDARAPAFVATPADAALPGFTDRFRARVGRAPDAGDRAVYLAARRIDIAVRAQDSVDDTSSLQSSVNK